MNVHQSIWSRTCNRKVLIENTQVCHYCITWITMTSAFRRFSMQDLQTSSLFIFTCHCKRTQRRNTPPQLQQRCHHHHRPPPSSNIPRLSGSANNEDSAGMHSGKYTPICLGLNKIRDLSHSRGRNVYWSNL